MKILNVFKRETVTDYEKIVEEVKNKYVKFENEIQQMTADKEDLQVQITNAILGLDYLEGEKLRIELSELEKKIEAKKDFLQEIHPEKSVVVKKAAIKAFDDVVQYHKEVIKEARNTDRVMRDKAKEFLDMMIECEQNSRDHGEKLAKSHRLLNVLDESEQEAQKSKITFTLGSRLHNWQQSDVLKHKLKQFIDELEKR